MRLREVCGFVLRNPVVRYGPDAECQWKSAAKYRKPLQCRPLLLGQERIAPIERGLERLMVGASGMAAQRAYQQLLLELCGKLGEGHGSDVRGGQLDCQGVAVEVAADGCHQRRICVIQLERLNRTSCQFAKRLIAV